MVPLIKICGLREADNIKAVAELSPDFLGFIFYPGSPRFAGEILSPESLKNLGGGIRKTGVFVNADFEIITGIVRKYSLDTVQLHGSESPDTCRRVKDTGVRVIKAFNIRRSGDFAGCSGYIRCTDYFLFDSATRSFGGSGNKFDWGLTGEYDLDHPFFISGGINPADISDIMSIANPSFRGIDLNSRFETRPGRKDTEKLKQFIKELRLKHKTL
jgi:phosphoribosylanthranilate isomerase